MASPAPPVTKTDPRDIPDAEFDELCLIGANDPSVPDRPCIHGCLVPRGETVVSPSPSADSIADSNFIESMLSARTCQHEANVQLIHVKCAAHRTQSSFLPPLITDASEQAPGSRWGPASLFAEVYVPPGG